MNKIIKFCLAGACAVGLFIVATKFHNIDLLTPVAIVDGKTQVVNVPQSQGMIYYLAFLVITIISTLLGKGEDSTLDGVISWGIAVVRAVAAFAMISGGASIFLMDNQILRIVQVLMFAIVLGIQGAVRKA